MNRYDKLVQLKADIDDAIDTLTELLERYESLELDLDKTKIGCEISFNKYFYQHKPLRSIEEISKEILALDKESDGLIMEILNMG